MKMKHFGFLFLTVFLISGSVAMARMLDCDIDDCGSRDYSYQYQYPTPAYAYPTPYPTPYETPYSYQYQYQTPNPNPDNATYAYPTPPFEYQTPPYEYPTPAYITPGQTGQGGTWLNMNFIVRDQNGRGVSGALVMIGRDDGNGNTRITDGGGFANFGVYEKQVINWSVQSGTCGSTSGTLYFDTSENWAFPKLNCPGGYPTPYQTPDTPVYNYQTPGDVGYQTPPANLPCKDVRANNYGKPLPCTYDSGVYPTPGIGYPTPGTGYPTPGTGYPTPGSYPTPSAFTVSVDAIGGGSIKSTDGEIDCGTVCSKNYPVGARVIIQSMPRSSYWKFAGWSGDCSGMGDCTLNINSAKNVSGRFVPRIFIYKEF